MARIPDTDTLFQGLRQGDRSILARAITLVESTQSTHEKQASDLIERCLPYSGNALRIAITGVPGVGKSTFIEALGNHLLKQKSGNIAVLAIDPSSSLSKGSILGDKTRMNELARAERVFIRPSAAGSSLGGVARRTRESMILCEAAGYEIILVETVGVGQSEHAVYQMTDLFLLLMLPGAGDELQGIKRGIMEMADIVVVNKAEGENESRAKRAALDLKTALHMLPPHASGWITRALMCSSVTGLGIPEISQSIEAFEQHVKASGAIQEKRKRQNLYWMQEHLRYLLESSFYNNAPLQEMLKQTENKVSEGNLSPFIAAKQLYNQYLETLKT